MNATSPIAAGWPFLVARGRHRGYSTLLAPGFLVAESDYGVLDEAVSPTAEPGRAEVISVITRAGHTLSVATTTHVVTAADLVPAQAGPRSTPPPPPRDEHSRPLTLLYGFVCRDAWISEPAPADLRSAHETALRVYREFLDDEDGFTVVAAESYDLRSLVVDTRTPVVNSGHHPPYAAAEPPARRGAAVPWNLAFIVLTAAVLAVFAAIWLGRSHQPDTECLNGANAAAHEFVDCDDPTAQFKVLGTIPDKTRAESKNIEICRSHRGTTTTFWRRGEGGGKGTALCLAPAE
jgi:hypothetical protein